MYVPLCAAWPLPDECAPLVGAPAVTGLAVEAASEVLWHLSGRQYGECEVVLRPCRQGCGPAAATSWWEGGWPALAQGWLSWVCGRCSGACSCTSADEVRLPADVTGVVSVSVDGTELAEGTDWTLYDGNVLVRLGAERWPVCQDWSVPVSGVGSWVVVARVGHEVPAMGRMALAELTRELVAACAGEDCALPANVVSQTRQGLSQQFATPLDLRRDDLTGLRLVDLWLQAEMRDRSGARIYDPERWATPRRPGARW